MYLYIYDSFLNAKRYSNLLARIETRLTDLGIGGKIFRLSPLRNTAELLRDETRSGVKTVVVVGNDKTVSRVVNLAAAIDLTLGIIPVDPGNTIAALLGISSPEEACNILAARKIERVDLGRANDTYFISGISVDGGNVTIECENKFRIRPSTKDHVAIYNLRPPAQAPNVARHFNPTDGFLEMFIEPFRKPWSFFKKQSLPLASLIPFKKIFIKSRDSVSIFTDGQRVLKTPVRVEIVPGKLKLIVGKNRAF